MQRSQSFCNAHNPNVTTDITELAPTLTMRSNTSLMQARHWQFWHPIAMEAEN
jgi:hypothetical protein